MDQYAIVELMGHRRFGARIAEVEQFGGKLMRAEILTAGDPVVQLISPSAIYAITQCTEAQARSVNTKWTLQSAVPMLPAEVPGASEPIDERVPTGQCSECGSIVPRDELEPRGDGGEICEGCRAGQVPSHDGDDEESPKVVPRTGGDRRCPSPCSECSEGDHHFSDMMIEFADNRPNHEAAKAGVMVWYQCKHCDAWREFTDDDADDGEDAEGAEAGA